MRQSDFYLELKAYVMEPIKTRDEGFSILAKYLKYVEGLSDEQILTHHLVMDAQRLDGLLKIKQFEPNSSAGLHTKIKKTDIPYLR